MQDPYLPPGITQEMIDGRDELDELRFDSPMWRDRLDEDEITSEDEEITED